MFSGCKDFDCCIPKLLSVNSDAVTIGGAVGNTADIELTCPISWVIQNLPEWLDYSFVPTADGATITLTANDTNNDTESRIETFTIMAANGDRVKITVTQNPFKSFTVTWALTGVTSDNMVTFVTESDNLNATFNPEATYVRPAAITVTMGGVLLTAVTDYTYNSTTGVFSITSVTGDLVITVTGVATYSLTVGHVTGQDDGYGTVTITTGSATGNVSGASVTVTAAPQGAYTFVKWVATDDRGATQVSTAASYTFAITANTTLYAVFAGDGSAAAPLEIATATELAALGAAVNEGADQSGVFYKLVADIDVGSAWTPIGYALPAPARPFSGAFDGGGHTVTMNGVAPVTSTSYYSGLFGYTGTGSRVQNLKVEGSIAVVTSFGTCRIGAIAGRSDGLIENCVGALAIDVQTTSSSSSDALDVGGIVGLVQTGTGVQNCYAVADVYVARPGVGSSWAGGIVGALDGGSTVLNCYSTGNITAVSGSGIAYAGGIAGQSIGSVSNCVALNGTITATTAGTVNIGRISGAAGFALANNRALDILLNGASVGAGALNNKEGLRIAPSDATTQSTYDSAIPAGAGWDFTTVWKMTPGAYPKLQWEP